VRPGGPYAVETPCAMFNVRLGRPISRIREGPRIRRHLFFFPWLVQTARTNRIETGDARTFVDLSGERDNLSWDMRRESGGRGMTNSFIARNKNKDIDSEQRRTNDRHACADEYRDGRRTIRRCDVQAGLWRPCFSGIVRARHDRVADRA